MSKNLDIKQFQKAGRDLAGKFKVYASFIFLLAVLFIYGFLVYSIGSAVQSEPSDSDVAEELSTAKRLKIDEDTIKKIEQLEDQNVGVQSLFQEARDNPFQD